MKPYMEIRSEKSSKIQQTMGQVNQLIDSVVTMQLHALQREISTSSKIVGELLRSDMITHIRSIPSLKLLVYELILKLAEQSQTIQLNAQRGIMLNGQGGYPLQQITMNRIQMYDQAVRKVLYSTRDILQELSWTYPVKSKSKSRTEKVITNSNPRQDNKIVYYQQELAHMIQEYQDHIKRNPIILPQYHSKEQEYDEEGQTALIQQLQEVIAKKEDRIKQLSTQLSQALLDQRSMENLIQQHQLQKDEAQQHIINLREQIGKLEHKNKMLSLNQVHNNFQNILQSDTQPQSSTNINDILKDDILQSQSLECLLFIQALSIEALISDD